MCGIEPRQWIDFHKIGCSPGIDPNVDTAAIPASEPPPGGQGDVRRFLRRGIMHQMVFDVFFPFFLVVV